MAIFQILMVISFQVKRGAAQNALVILGMYLFGVAYSPGEGPVPFVRLPHSRRIVGRMFWPPY